MGRHSIAPERLRWKADTSSIEEDSTRDMPLQKGTAGQDSAKAALRYAILCPGPGQHVFVQGPHGSRRRKLIESIFSQLNPEPRQSRDFCFVHNFANPDRPQLVVLPSGQGRSFQYHMHRIGLFVKERLPEILGTDPIRSRRESRKSAAEREIHLLLRPFEKQLENDGLGLIRSQSGPGSRLEIGVKVMGKPVSQEEFRNMVARKQASDTDRRNIGTKIEAHQPELQRITRQIRQIWQKAQHHIEQINISEAARLLGEMSAEVTEKIKAEGVEAFLRDVIDDVLEKRVGHETTHLVDPTVIYSVNVLRKETRKDHAAVIYPNLISAGNLFGSVDPAWRSGERAVASFRGIHAGALIEADGGYLVLDADDLLSQPQLFQRLLRTLRTGAVEILAPTPDWSYAAQSLKPQPVPIDCTVILVGDGHHYDRLLELNREFPEQFRILAQLDDQIERDKAGTGILCNLIATMAREQSLLPLDRTALGALLEYSARQSDRPSHYLVNPDRLLAIAREASFIAAESSGKEVTRDEVEQAIARNRERTSLPYRQILQDIRQGHAGIQLRGKSSAQVNTMTLHHNAASTFALPTQILGNFTTDGQPGIFLHPEGTVSSASNGGPECLLSIVSDLLRLDHPLKLKATFEFNVLHDPDDASATTLAQACAIVAMLAGTPMKQDTAIIGSLDVRGQIRAVSYINERIEGFFEACSEVGLSGQQSVGIPRENAEGLMLEQKVVSACTNDTFSVAGIESLSQAIELATGQRPGVWKDAGFPEGSLLARARERAQQLSG